MSEVSIETKALIERIKEVYEEIPELVSSGGDVSFYVSIALTELMLEARRRGIGKSIDEYLDALSDVNAVLNHLMNAGAGVINQRAVQHWAGVLTNVFRQSGDPAAVFSACVDALMSGDLLAKSNDDEVALSRQVLINMICFKAVTQPLILAILRHGTEAGGHAPEPSTA